MWTAKRCARFSPAPRSASWTRRAGLLPQQLRDFAGLVKNVAVVGCDDHAELWDSEAWAPVHEGETTPEYIAAMMKELNF